MSDLLKNQFNCLIIIGFSVLVANHLKLSFGKLRMTWNKQEMKNNLPTLIQSSTIVNNRLKQTLPTHLWVNQLLNSQINLNKLLDLMVLHIVVEVVTEEGLVVVKIEVAEEVSKLVEVKDNNLDNLTGLIQAK